MAADVILTFMFRLAQTVILKSIGHQKQAYSCSFSCFFSSTQCVSLLSLRAPRDLMPRVSNLDDRKLILANDDTKQTWQTDGLIRWPTVCSSTHTAWLVVAMATITFPLSSNKTISRKLQGWKRRWRSGLRCWTASFCVCFGLFAVLQSWSMTDAFSAARGMGGGHVSRHFRNSHKTVKL